MLNQSKSQSKVNLSEMRGQWGGQTEQEQLRGDQSRRGRRRDRPEFVQPGESVSSGVTSQMDRHRQRRGRWMREDAQRDTRGPWGRRGHHHMTVQRGPRTTVTRMRGEGTEYKENTTRQWTKTTHNKHGTHKEIIDTPKHKLHHGHREKSWERLR